MKKVFALIGAAILCSQLAGCNSTPTKNLVSSVRSQVTTQSFAQWCAQKKTVPAATKHTIEVLLKKAGTNNCQLADRQLSSLKSLDVNRLDISDVKPLASLTNLTSLEFSGNQEVRDGISIPLIDLTPLASLKNLKKLDLSSNAIVDLKPISGLTQLTNLDLSSNKILDLEPLAALTNLSKLDLHSNEQLMRNPKVDRSDLFAIADLPLFCHSPE
jgi:internalin A